MLHRPTEITVVSGPWKAYQLSGRYRGQSGRQNRWKIKILTSAFGHKRTVRCRNLVGASWLFAGLGDHFRVIGIGSSLGDSK